MKNYNNENLEYEIQAMNSLSEIEALEDQLEYEYESQESLEDLFY